MTNLKNKNILITGANGFLGSQLCAAFTQEGTQVIALHRDGSDLTRLQKYAPTVTCEILKNDYSNLNDIVAKHKPDIVIHTAAAQDGNEDDKAVRALIETNLMFSTLLLSAMRQNNINYFINTGTSWQNYNQSDYDPVNLYAATKQAFESVLTYYQNTGLHAVTLRLFDSYGPDDPRGKITNLLKRISEKGETLAMSPGAQQFDLVHVEDTARGYVLAAQLLLDGRAEKLYTLSGGNPIGLKDFVSVYETARNVKCPIEWGGRPYRAREPMTTWRGGTVLPGWQPQIKLEDGLKSL